MPTISVNVNIPTDHDIKSPDSAAVKDIIANLFPYDPRFEALKAAGCSVEITVLGPQPETVPVTQPVEPEVEASSDEEQETEEQDENND